MKITDDHWLDTAIRKPIPGGAAMLVRRFLVFHFTAGATGESSIRYWKEKQNGVCAHLVIERDGTIKQCRPFNRTCGHAGLSKWNGYTGLNSNSIGIELANAGDDDPALSWARKQPGFFSIKARHKNGGPLSEWEGFPLAQLISCEEASKVIKARYNLDDAIGHEDIAPSRKTDPGPAFPMLAMREALGFSGLPKP
jgi:N-acetylmuramoyl-L-alanine amidase